MPTVSVVVTKKGNQAGSNPARFTDEKATEKSVIKSASVLVEA